MKNNRYSQLQTVNKIKKTLMESATNWRQLRGCYPTLIEVLEHINESIEFSIFNTKTIDPTIVVNEQHCSEIAKTLVILNEDAADKFASMSDAEFDDWVKVNARNPEAAEKARALRAEGLGRKGATPKSTPSSSSSSTPSSTPTPSSSTRTSVPTTPTPSPAPKPDKFDWKGTGREFGKSLVFQAPLGLLGSEFARTVFPQRFTNSELDPAQILIGALGQQVGDIAGHHLNKAAIRGAQIATTVNPFKHANIVTGLEKFSRSKPAQISSFKSNIAAEVVQRALRGSYADQGAAGKVPSYILFPYEDYVLPTAAGIATDLAFDKALKSPKFGKYAKWADHTTYSNWLKTGKAASKRIPVVGPVLAATSLGLAAGSARGETPLEKTEREQDIGDIGASIVNPAYPFLRLAGFERPAVTDAREKEELDKMYKEWGRVGGTTPLTPEQEEERDAALKQGARKQTREFEQTLLNRYRSPQEIDRIKTEKKAVRDEWQNAGEDLSNMIKQGENERKNTSFKTAVFEQAPTLKKYLGEGKLPIKIKDGGVHFSLKPSVEPDELLRALARRAAASPTPNQSPVPKANTAIPATDQGIDSGGQEIVGAKMFPMVKKGPTDLALRKPTDLALRKPTDLALRKPTDLALRKPQEPDFTKPKPKDPDVPSPRIGFGMTTPANVRVNPEERFDYAPNELLYAKKPTGAMSVNPFDPSGKPMYFAQTVRSGGIMENNELNENKLTPSESANRKAQKQKYRVVYMQDGKKVEVFASSLRGVKRVVHGKSQYRIYDAKGSDVTGYFKREIANKSDKD